MPRLTRSHRLMLCGGIAALVYLAGLGAPALWEPDEGRYAEIAREMAVSGDYVTPRNNRVRYFEKPPLVYWAGAVAVRALGRSEFAVRCPAALASAGSVVVTAAAAEMMLGPAVGMLAALALGLSPLFLLFARLATPDPELALFFSAALFAFYAAAGRDFRRGAGRHLMLAAAALLGLATLVKGPVALVLGGAIALAWLVSQGRAREISRIRWPECVATYLALTVPWFAVAAARNPGFLRFFFLHEHVQRFLSATEHGWGPWFFIPVAIAGTWPFFYFAPIGIAALRDSSHPGDSGARSAALRFLLIWFAIVFAFFSVPRAKLAEYLLPGLPPLAILAAAGLARVRLPASRGANRLLRGFAAINVVLMLLGAATIAILRSRGALPVDATFLPLRAGNPLDTLYVDAMLLLAALGLPVLVWWVCGLAGRAVPALVGVMALLTAIVVTRARLDATPLGSYRELARVIAPELEPGCALVSYHHFVQALPFYTGRLEKLVGYRGELAPFGDGPDAAGTFLATDARLRALWSTECVVLIVNRADLGQLVPVLDPKPLVLGCEGKKLALGNRKPTRAAPPADCGELPGTKSRMLGPQ